MILASLIISCKKDVDADLNQSIWLKYGQTVNIEGTSILFDTIEEESRCPSNARCIWAGRFIAGLKIEGDKLALGTDSPLLVWSGHELELLAVDPVSFTSEKMPAHRAYRIQIILRP